MDTPDAFDIELRDALALDADELAYLSSLDLASRWRTRPATADGSLWGWLALLAVVGGYAAWSFVAPVIGPFVGTSTQLFLGGLTLSVAFGPAFTLGQTVVDVARHPAIGLSPVFLAVLGLAVLAWPRALSPIRSALT